MRYEVIYRALPIGIHGAVMELKPNSEYLVLIDNTITEEEQAESLRHELYHIEHGHFEDIRKGTKTLSGIETETHKAIEGR